MKILDEKNGEIVEKIYFEWDIHQQNFVWGSTNFLTREIFLSFTAFLQANLIHVCDL